MNNYIPTFNRVTIHSILTDLHKKKVTVVVPQVALYTDEEISIQREPTYYMDNAPIHHKSYIGNDVVYTGITDNIVDGEVIEKSKMNKVMVRLPLSTVIDIYHKSYSVYIPRDRNDLKSIIEFLDEIMHRLENSSDKRAPELFEYIDEFYNTVLKNQKEAIVRKFTTFDNAPKGAKPIAGFSKGLLEERDVNAATFIDLDSVIVK